MKENENGKPTLGYTPSTHPEIEALRKSVDEMMNSTSEKMGLFLVKDGNTWLQEASLKPIPGMLFSEMWYTGELCILFADTNTGKSILAVQIADSISRGVAIPGFKLEEPAQPVLYFDFELRDKQFEMRYSIKSTQHYSFSHNFYRAEIDPDAEIPGNQLTFEDYLNQSIEHAILETGAKALIIDNITYLRTENEKAKDASALMKHLNNLKKKYDLSILVLAHTPKRDMTQPLTMNHLQGSRMLMNFLDACFCIGVSRQNKNLRYLKQLKIRAGQLEYCDDNVCVCSLEKPHNFLNFSFINYGREREHLAERTEQDKGTLIAKCKELKAEGLSERAIAEKLGIGKGTVGNYLKSDAA